MDACKKVFLFFCLVFLSSSYSYAAYFNPWQIGDEAAINKYLAAKQKVAQQNADFWRDIKPAFKDYFFKGQASNLRAYLFMIGVIFEIVKNEGVLESSPASIRDIFKEQVNKVVVEYANPKTFFAYVLLEDMILSSVLFNALQNKYYSFSNGFRAFWVPIQNLFTENEKNPNFNRLLSFCEIIVFVRSIESVLLDKQEQYFKNKNQDVCKISSKEKADYKEQENKWFGDFMLSIPENKYLLNKVKSIWPKKMDDYFWTNICYKLIENFCVNTSKFRELQGY